MNKQIAVKWDALYQSAAALPAPASVLADNLFLLPAKGLALDLACGLGANAILLAQQGLTTEAMDISMLGLQKLQQQAQAQGLSIRIHHQDVQAQMLAKERFDVVVVSRFLDRLICDAIMDSLKPNGLLFYQTFSQVKVHEHGPKNPAFLLAENELLGLFAKLQVLYYRENGRVGTLTQGLRNEVQLIGQKR